MLLTIMAIDNKRFAKRKYGKDITLIEGYKYAIGSIGIMANWAFAEIFHK
jgi:hypothetical protein